MKKRFLGLVALALVLVVLSSCTQPGGGHQEQVVPLVLVHLWENGNIEMMSILHLNLEEI